MGNVLELRSIDNDIYLSELNYILENENIDTFYQPIVSLAKGDIIGYEALSRGPKNSILKYPDKLFDIAIKNNKTWELELLCRTKAIKRAKNLKKDRLLFINVDPHIFRDELFKKGFTKEFIEKNNMQSKNIIFEITERTCIEDYISFKYAIDNYIQQGFKIAIDDMGSGYSGLNTIIKTKPHFIKIDMDLIRDIDKDDFKQALIKAFVKLSKDTNMKIIAEGIETEYELRTLIRLGVYAGQGYFISKPKEDFIEIDNNLKKLIIKCNKDKLYKIKYHIKNLLHKR